MTNTDSLSHLGPRNADGVRSEVRRPANRRHLVAFVHIEKTAGITISHVLRSTFGIRHCGVRPLGEHRARRHLLTPADLRFALRLHPIGLRTISGHSVTPHAGLEEVVPIRFFTFLRDPIRQCASYYQYLVDRHSETTDFDTWIRTDWPRNMQCRRLAGIADANAAIEIIGEKRIFVGLVEEFDNSLSLLKELLIPELNLGYRSRNVAPRQSVSRDLLGNPRTLDLLSQATAEDQKLYQYAKQAIIPCFSDQADQEPSVGTAVSDPQSVGENKFNQMANLAYRNLIYKPGLRMAESLGFGRE